ncbi:MAG TPA: hypothetical protein VFL62_25290 [Bradyrhizobium sp.]|uniref:hypothetical protein n=1 Tax=Bradyrhizobium sp. TaxID=376 RepID=UPI002D8047E4|nr:hypothetical protein [Bradyrhizobium sp.]HET7889559.1 hypothetical protein [Bradyrhizobium sp.]
MSMVGFPLLLIPLAIYNIIVFLMPGVSLAEPLVTLPLPTSGAQWPLALSDILVALGILMLLFEVIKGARPGAKYLTDHLLSLIVFGAALAEFLLWPRFASSAFFLLTLLALVDFLSGVTLRVRRGVPAAVAPGRAARRRPAAEVNPHPEPAEPHGGAGSPTEAGLGASEGPAPSSSAYPEASEPAFRHPETTTAGSHPDANTPASHIEHDAQQPPEATRR